MDSKHLPDHRDGSAWAWQASGNPAEVARVRQQLHICYACSMSEVALRELRNNAASVLRRAQAGEQIVITSRGKPVASLDALEHSRRHWLPRAELIKRLAVAQADPGLRKDLARLAADTTEDLGSIL
jgi:prevent-host-death family protein